MEIVEKIERKHQKHARLGCFETHRTMQTHAPHNMHVLCWKHKNQHGALAFFLTQGARRACAPRVAWNTSYHAESRTTRCAHMPLETFHLAWCNARFPAHGRACLCYFFLIFSIISIFFSIGLWVPNQFLGPTLRIKTNLSALVCGAIPQWQ